MSSELLEDLEDLQEIERQKRKRKLTKKRCGSGIRSPASKRVTTTTTGPNDLCRQVQ
ncbi:MAG: hypothetical protein RL701_3866 [Pseudomonadota bacterium]|jgi:hypothetical protein